uniref:phosphatidylinositol-3,4,5-trisphosphate 5-phosphatase n=4 Tax=Aves TaxID=8782 RepID=A0A8C4JZ92_DRONO
MAWGAERVSVGGGDAEPRCPQPFARGPLGPAAPPQHPAPGGPAAPQHPWGNRGQAVAPPAGFATGPRSGPCHRGGRPVPEAIARLRPRGRFPAPLAAQVKLDVTLGDLTKIGKSQKYTLSVDVEGGKLVVLKKQKDSQEDWNTFTHDKIRQLIKSQRVQNKLGIVFEKEKDKTQRKDFIFVSARKREAFCQLLQLMKNRHSHQDEPDMISIFIGTWNMGSVPPPKSITSWFTSKGLGKTLDEATVAIPHDIYVFGTQENSLGDKEWVDFLRAVLKDFTETEYRPVAMQSLWNIKIAVLVKPEHENRISHVSTSSVKTGIANTLGNKGAVGVSFMFNGTSFGFVNCHLTSGNEKTARRNQNYLDILRLLSLGDKQLSSFDISLRFTHLFWFGDLNYRLDMDIQEILNYISRKEFEPLLKVDQLNLEKEKHKVFLRFGEEEITFPPTYRYERGSRDTYVWHKQKPTGVRTNVPSWCDRILWKSYPETHVNCNSYGERGVPLLHAAGGEPAACPLGKLVDEPEKGGASPAGRPAALHRGTSKDEAAPSRPKAEGVPEAPGAPPKNSFNNPAYYVLEGVPHPLPPPETPAPQIPVRRRGLVPVLPPAPRRAAEPGPWLEHPGGSPSASGARSPRSSQHPVPHPGGDAPSPRSPPGTGPAAGGRRGAAGGGQAGGGGRPRPPAHQKRLVLRALGFLWKEERTPEKGPGTASAGCQALRRSAALAVPLLVLTPGQTGAFRGGAGWPGPSACPTPGLGLRLPPGLLRPPGAGSEAVLSGVGLQFDSLDSSSSDEERGSDFLPAPGPVPVPPVPLALAARSCLRNLARRFWNQTCSGARGGGPGQGAPAQALQAAPGPRLAGDGAPGGWGSPPCRAPCANPPPS